MSTLLLDEPALVIQPKLAMAVGNNEAIVLQQVHYWLSPRFQRPEKFIKGHYWTYNTYKQWHAQMPIFSQSTLRRAVANLEEMGLLISFMATGFRKRKYYRIDYARLESLTSRGREIAHFVHEETQRQEKELAKNAQPFVAITHDVALEFEKERPAAVIQEITTRHKKWENEIEMCSVFSRIVLDGRPLAIYPERRERLALVFETVLGGDIDKWHTVCNNVTRSLFLMGESKSSNFRATLDWVSTQENTTRILEGESYGIGDRKGYLDTRCDAEEELRQSFAKAEAKNHRNELIQHELSLIEDASWRKVAEHYIQQYGIHGYQNVLKNVRFERVGDAGTLVCQDEQTMNFIGSARKINNSLWAGYPECNVWDVKLVVEEKSVMGRCA